MVTTASSPTSLPQAPLPPDAAMGLTAVAVEEKPRSLEIPPPPGRREKVVDDAVDALADQYAEEVTKAEKTIAEFGLSIEVTRLRDRLHRSVGTDLQRLLLATPGVSELLFNEAIAQQLEEEEEAGSPVQDESVLSVANQVQLASSKIDSALSAINETTKQFQESTRQIVEAVVEVAKAIKGDEEHPEPKPENPTVRSGNKTTRTVSRGRDKTRIPGNTPTEERSS